MKNNIFPSILDVSPDNMVNILDSFQANQISGVHVDIMDAHYVPKLGFNAKFVKWLNDKYSYYLDLHLMISSPEKYLETFAWAGANAITLHSDCEGNLYYMIQYINQLGIDAGVALNPGISPNDIEFVLPLVHHVLVMTANPGRISKTADLQMLEKIRWLVQKRKKENLGYRIEVDGGINADNIKKFAEVGCDDFVSGKYLTSAFNPVQNFKKLLNEANRV